MKNLINILKLLGIAAWLLAAIGGVCYCCYYGQYVVAFAILILAGLAFPTVRKFWPSSK